MACFGEDTHCFGHGSGHHGVGIDVFRGLEALLLDSPGLYDSFSNFGTFFSRAAGRHLIKGDRGHFYVQVDAIQQWATDFVEVAAHGSCFADTFLGGVVVVAAGAGVHAGNEHKAGREVGDDFGARDGDFALFQGLPHDFECRPSEFWQLVQKEDAVVCERYFAGLRNAATAYERYVADGMVRRAKGPGSH